ncbi:MAG TPA: ATP-grasp domain-containing protein [Chloroflexota bacterium]|nr:ATP-grasp domain-containing protein [Chloroflexota bacterium]
MVRASSAKGSAFVTDALLRKSVVVCQSLGRRGVNVSAGSTTRLSPAFFSRYCRESVVYPSPRTQPGAFVDRLLEYLRRQPHDVLLPTDDATLTAVSAHRTDFEQLTRVPIPNAPQLAYGLDKARVMQLAEQLGIPHPKTLLPTRADDAADLARHVTGSLVIKPRSSSGGRGIAYLGPDDNVAHTWTQVHAQHPFPMVQACIPAGPKFDVGVLMDARGHAVASFVQKELRHFPMRDGLSTMQESVWRPDLVERAVTLLQTIGWYGLAEVEFMEDPRTGEALLLEVNPRFWASIQLAVACGVNFPFLLYQLATGQRFRDTHKYAIGRRCRWLIPGDCLHFLVNPQRLRLDPPFFQFRPGPSRTETVYDGFYPEDRRATLGLLLSTAHYLFDADVWTMLLRRGERAGAPVLGRAALGNRIPDMLRSREAA